MTQSINIPPSLQSMTILSRNHRRTPFHPEKIAIAIKKGFDSLSESDYTDEDSFIVYQHVIDQLAILSVTQQLLPIEDIQDTIEKQLLKLGYEDVYESFASYRLRRSESRKVFLSSQHKFLKAIENLSFNEEDHENPFKTLIDFGAVITRQFARAYLVNSDFISLHDDGFIHIHNLQSYPLATTASLVIPVNSILGAESVDFGSALNMISLTIERLQMEQHGEHSIDDFDEGLIPSVLTSFKRIFKQMLENYQLISKQPLSKWEACKKQIDKLKTMDVDLSAFEKYFDEENDDVLSAIYEQSVVLLENEIYLAISVFLDRLVSKNYLPLSLNIGLSTSKEGRLVAKQLLIAFKKNPIYPTIIFKLGEGVNVEFEDLNYDLFTLALEMNQESEAVLFQNSDVAKAAYLPSGVRIAKDIHQQGEPELAGRGLISMTSVNLVRLSIHHQNDKEAFMSALRGIIKQVVEQLIERYEFQCKRRIDYFPALFGDRIYLEADKLKPNNDLSRSLRHGMLGINLIGLSQVDNEAVLKLVNEIIEESCQKYSLNFGLLALDFADISARFQELDQLIYGRVAGITDSAYSNGVQRDQSRISGGHKLLLDEFELSDIVGFFKIKSNRDES